MAERFADPLFEKIGALSVEGWIRWIEYFDMETESEHVPEKPSNDIAEYFEGRGAKVF